MSSSVSSSLVSFLSVITSFTLDTLGMTGPCTGPALLSKESSKSFLSVNVCVQESKPCNAFVQESLLEVGVQQVGEGRSPDLEETVQLRSRSSNSRRKPKLKSGEETKICATFETFTHVSIK